MQIERLIQMIFYIVNHEHVKAKELANYFDVSTRTIYRDINTLTLAGIPIISTKGTGGGITLIEGYSIDRSVLSKDEQQNIYHGLQILQETNYPNAKVTLNKICTIFKNALEPKWLDIDFTYWGSDEKEKVKFSNLQYAITNKHLITFKYFNSELEKSKKIIEPLRLMFKSHAWYIIGYYQNKEEVRIFRMSRMKDIEILPETFTRELPNDYSLTNEYQDNCKFLVFKLKFSPEIAHKIYDDFQEHQVVEYEDGSYFVEMRYELNNWIFNYLLSFGKYVEIIEPEIARTMLKEKALEIAKLYE